MDNLLILVKILLMKIFFFNVNGICVIVQKSFVQDMKILDLDIICLQEIKVIVEQVKDMVKGLEGYYVYVNEVFCKGYFGMVIISKKELLLVVCDMGVEEYDNEGCIICVEYEDFYFIMVYVLNLGSELLCLDYCIQWDRDFLNYFKKLEVRKLLVICGDLNVVYKFIDFVCLKENYNKLVGYMQQEIDGMDVFVGVGLVDMFCVKNGDEICYFWWFYCGGVWEKNVGWRIDYFLVSEFFLLCIQFFIIYNEVYGLDYCLVFIEVQ